MIRRTNSVGRVFKSICYVSRKPSKMKDLTGNEIDVVATFPYNPESKTAPETAKAWAQGRYSWDADHEYQPEVLTRANDPIELKLVDLSIRSEGGRAYKVLDPENRLFDLREDQLLEVIAQHGIQLGGKLVGTFVFAALESQVRLVLVGGDLHTQLVRSTELFETESASTASQLSVGHVYARRNQTHVVYLGKIRLPGPTGTVTQHAFIELRLFGPQQRWDSKLKEYVDNSKEWEVMTLAERVKDHIRQNLYGTNVRTNVMTLESPKVGTDIGEIDVARYRDEVLNGTSAAFKIVNGGKAGYADWRRRNYANWVNPHEVEWHANRWHTSRDLLERYNAVQQQHESETYAEYLTHVSWV